MSATQAPQAIGTKTDADPRPADVLVIFGITGDLAKVMTFHSLYRLEQRGLLDCPIVGVAFDDWTLEQLVQRARDSIVATGEELDEEVFTRFAKRLSYHHGDFTDDATYAEVAEAIEGSKTPVFYLEVPPSLFGTVVGGLAKAGVTANARVVVEKPFGHDTASARALAEELHQYIDESQLLRIDHYLGKMGIEEILYLRFANTMLEPVWNRNYVESRPDHDGRGLRGRGPRPLLRPGRRSARRRRQPPHAGRRHDGDGAACRRRHEDAPGREGRALSGRSDPADPAHYVRGQYDGYLAIDGVAPDSTTETYTALRLEIENWRWSGVPVLHPHRQAAPGHADGGPARLQACAAARLRGVRPRPEPNQLVIKLDPTTGVRDRARRASRGHRGTAAPILFDVEFATMGGEGATPYEVLLHAAHGRRERRASRGRTASSRRGGSCSRSSTRLRRCMSTRPGSWGPTEADELVAGHGRWHEPWIES